MRKLIAVIMLMWCAGLQAQQVPYILCDSVQAADLWKPAVYSVHTGAFIDFRVDPATGRILRTRRPGAFQRWLSFEVPFDTMLVFTITPLDGKTDFDFHLFHDDADSFCYRFETKSPMPLRSCLAQPRSDSATGISWRAANAWEGGGPTAPYVKPMRVKKGQHFYLLVQVSNDGGNPGIVMDKRFRLAFWEAGAAPHITLRNVYFDNNKALLQPASYTALDAMLTQLKQKGNPAVKIVGHTDNAGSEPANAALSTARAKAVYDYFISKGYPAKNIGYEGRGSRFPVADNSTDNGKALNRRVEVEFGN